MGVQPQHLLTALFTFMKDSSSDIIFEPHLTNSLDLVSLLLHYLTKILIKQSFSLFNSLILVSCLIQYLPNPLGFPYLLQLSLAASLSWHVKNLIFMFTMISAQQWYTLDLVLFSRNLSQHQRKRFACLLEYSAFWEFTDPFWICLT